MIECMPVASLNAGFLSSSLDEAMSGVSTSVADCV